MERAGEEHEKQRVVIIGGGIAGAASAWALSQSGAYDCLVLEREAQLAAHSTSKNACILRSLTGTWASTALALETAEFLRHPPAGFAPVPLLDEVGLILVHPSLDPALYKRWLARKAPASALQLTPEQLQAAWPPWAGAQGPALLVRDEGHIDTSALFDGLVREAKRHGARFVLEAEVLKLEREGARLQRVQMRTGQSFKADQVLIAGGAWARQLGRRAGSDLPLEACRRHLMVTAPEERIDRRWPILWSEQDNFYVRPESGGLMLCACDQDVVDPDRCGVRPEVREQIAQRTAQCLPDFADASCAHFWSGMRTFAPDPEFVIGFDGSIENLFWVAGLGGHGMSTCIGVGRLVAALLSGQAVDQEIARACDPRRLQSARARTLKA